MSKPYHVMRIIPLAAFIVLLLILTLQSPSVRATSALGITPTPTPTATATPLPTPTPTPVVGVADPAITKRGEPEEAHPGEEVTFTLEVTNQGQQSAVDVVVTDVIPEYLEILDVTATQGTATIEGQTVRIEVGVVGPDFVVTIVICTRVRQDAPAPLDMENAATLTLPDGGERISPSVVIVVPSPLLPPTGQTIPLWLVYAVLGGSILALGVGLRKQKLAR